MYDKIHTAMETKEIIIKGNVNSNPNVVEVMEAVKHTTRTEGTILGINFMKILHTIVLF